MNIPNKHSVIEAADAMELRDLGLNIEYALRLGGRAIRGLDGAFRDIQGQDIDMGQAFARAIGKGITHQGINPSGMQAALKSELESYRRKVVSHMKQ